MSGFVMVGVFDYLLPVLEFMIAFLGRSLFSAEVFCLNRHARQCTIISQ